VEQRTITQIVLACKELFSKIKFGMRAIPLRNLIVTFSQFKPVGVNGSTSKPSGAFRK